MRAYCLVSSSGGGGRSFITANLASLLADSQAQRVILLERAQPETSELGLHLGLAPSSLDQALSSPPGSVCLVSTPALTDLGTALDQLRTVDAWVFCDGVSLDQAGWEPWLEACGRALLCERGDLIGFRRASRLLKSLENAHFQLSSLHLAWAGCGPAQPLPTLPGLNCTQLPFYPKALERLASGLTPTQAEPTSSLAKAFKELAAALEALPELSRSQSILPDLKVSAPALAPSVDIAVEIALLRRVLEDLRQELNLAKVHVHELASKTFRRDWTPRVSETAARLLAKEDAAWLDRDARARLQAQLVQLVLGYGPLESALDDPEVTEIMVNRHDQVYLEKHGKVQLSPIRFWDEAQVQQVIERIVAPLGRRIDESSPKVDARLPDGSRVNAIIPPLALKGPCLTIRKFPLKRLGMPELLERGALTQAAAQFLHLAVEHKQNILVSGGTGSGKTTLLNALSSYIPSGERIVTIEDSAELKLQQEHVVTLESRPKNLEGTGEVSIRDLVINSLRMRPDRIVVGECRGGEALDMLQAMNTGHEGSMSTLHANSSRDALSRLETLCLMNEVELPLAVVRKQIASAVNLIVQIGRLRDGSRRVLAITEILGMEGDVITAQDLFSFQQTGMSAEGRVEGLLQPSGLSSEFFQKLRSAGYEADPGLFQLQK